MKIVILKVILIALGVISAIAPATYSFVYDPNGIGHGPFAVPRFAPLIIILLIVFNSVSLINRRNRNRYRFYLTAGFCACTANLPGILWYSIVERRSPFSRWEEAVFLIPLCLVWCWMLTMFQNMFENGKTGAGDMKRGK